MSTHASTTANVTATLALFVALGGSATRPRRSPAGTVRNGTLTGSDVKNNSLRGADIRTARCARPTSGGDLPGRSAGAVSRRTQVSVPDD